MMEDTDYYKHLPSATVPKFAPLSPRARTTWQFFAIVSLTLGGWYLSWRFNASFNPDAPIFSVAMFAAEFVMYLGTFVFFFDVWEEPAKRIFPPGAALPKTARSVDVFITTYDEATALVEDSLRDALALDVPKGWSVQVSVLDDGDRTDIKDMTLRHGATYFARQENVGFKAGNLKNALWQTSADFVVIADADTRLFPSFLRNTLGYFSDTNVAWVQTPHWFYDIPAGRKIMDFVPSAWTKKWMHKLSGVTIGGDPFSSASDIFFDVIQRRRDRHGASFCCGAGSIHRREALFEVALKTSQERSDGALPALQPFQYHVSEDILTSMELHAKKWTSRYHPQVEAKMLSPWSVEAWAAQKLKYAGGSLDIAVHRLPRCLMNIPWRVRLHYLATFWSYFAVIPYLFLLMAPVFTLFTGIAPVASYSAEFFIHLLPFLVSLEIAVFVGMKGYDIHGSRAAAVMSMPFVVRGVLLVLSGKKIAFKPTPKTLQGQRGLQFLWPHMAVLALFALAVVYGVTAYLVGSRDHTLSMLVVNVFWLAWNGLALSRALRLLRWDPQSALQSQIKGENPCNPQPV